MSNRKKGILFVLIGAILWGVSGTVVQRLFEEKAITPSSLVTIRLLISGVLLLFFSSIQQNKRMVWDIWKDKKDRASLIIFGIVGVLGVQYTFFVAIDYGNAATATLLQYIAPALITCYIAIKLRRMPSRRETGAIILAFVGTALLVTNGHADSISISSLALFWGLCSAVALAFYTLYPLQLLARWGSAVVVGWSMLIGGVCIAILNAPWHYIGQLSLWTIGAIIFVILFGTLLSFYLYLESMRYITATETSLFSCVEPLTAAVISVFWLHVPFGIMEWIGGLCIITTIFMLSAVSVKKPATERLSA